MTPRGRRRQILLYLISVVLPSSLLIAFTLRLISQDRELAQKRRAEQRQSRALEVGRDLSAVLDEARSQAISLSMNSVGRSASRKMKPPLILTGAIRDTGMSWPWESVGADAEQAARLREPGFQARSLRAERAEFSEANFEKADPASN